ncbi:MAG: 6-pyruvoyl-tetrahydropterin synthase-related protein [Anaerolineae bacterium]|nr:6-pyruvoyl-tetrahydropterin synthase-related protein [Anaerolineae bacterium]
MTRLRNHFDRELILLLIFSIFAVAALLSPGFFFRAHDADHTVFYLIEFDASIRDGILWPRWSPDHAMGYGYPFWVVYAPLAYFAAEVFHLLGVGFTASIKIVMALSALFGGWGMYALLRRWWGRNGIGRGAALVGGLVYVYAPYHLLTLYVRAAFAEYVAMAWFPWVILAFDDVVEWGGLRRIALAALALGALFLTHSATLMVFTPLLAIYLLFALVRKTIRQRREQESWRQVIGSFAQVVAAGLLAVGLAAIFLLPLAAEQGAVQQKDWVAENYLYQKHFVWPNQFVDPFWGFGFSDDPTGPNDGMSFQLGIVGVVLALVAAVVGLRRASHRRGQTAFFVVALLAVLLLMMPLARPVWDAFGPAALIQFPWRLLSTASLFLAILAGAAVGNTLGTGEGSQFPAAHVLGLVVVLASLAFTVPQYTDIQPIDESVQSIMRFELAYPDMIGHTAAVQESFTESPLLPQYLAGEPLQKVALIAGSGEVETLRTGGSSVDARVNLDSPSTVLFYTYDFPGWRATVDGQPAAHRTEPPYGLIAVDVPAGDHRVSIRHGGTPDRDAGTWISVVSLALVAGLLIFDWSRTRRKAAKADGSRSRPT